MGRIHDLLRYLKDCRGSDLHLGAGLAPLVRLHGRLEAVQGCGPLDDQALRSMLFELTTPRQREQFERTGDLDFAFGLDGVARFRTNYLVQEGGAAAVFRIIPDQIVPLADLKMPPAVEGLCHLRSGLVLVTGPTGSGKSTTLSAIIDTINSTYSKHIVAVEDPVEFLHHSKRSIISQREVGTDTESFGAALRGAIRQDADVVLVGEMRDLETVDLALTAAEMGALVFGTLHTSSASKTIDRIIDVFPPDRQPQVRSSLSESLQGVVAQLLLRTTDGKGRIAAVEILLTTEGLPSMIRQGKTSQIDSIIATGKRQGMQAMDDSLFDLVERKLIGSDEAYIKAKDKRRFEEVAGE
ncbi:MAG: PilT/PilU family type 4a pilus ATPase [Myxococcales bacterium]|nr:PilT/PilU family type 4a pilus ATPase [Myxococcales bacterium]